MVVLVNGGYGLVHFNSGLTGFIIAVGLCCVSQADWFDLVVTQLRSVTRVINATYAD